MFKQSKMIKNGMEYIHICMYMIEGENYYSIFYLENIKSALKLV